MNPFHEDNLQGRLHVTQVILLLVIALSRAYSSMVMLIVREREALLFKMKWKLWYNVPFRPIQISVSEFRQHWILQCVTFVV